MATTSATSTLQRIASGDESAVQECIDRYGNLVWSLARRLCGNQSEAEDAVQEIFVDVWRSAGRYDETVASEATFIAMISRRRLIDRRRKKSRQPKMVSAPPEMHADGTQDQQTVEVSDEASKARRAFRGLSPDQQRVLQLSLQYGLSHQRISEATGLPLGTVKTHARRGLMRVRESLTQTEDQPENDSSGGSQSNERHEDHATEPEL